MLLLVIPNPYFKNLILLTPINFTNLKIEEMKEDLLVDMGYIQFTKKNSKISIRELKVMGWLAMYSSSSDLTSFF
jgi:hypothetical protein